MMLVFEARSLVGVFCADLRGSVGVWVVVVVVVGVGRVIVR